MFKKLYNIIEVFQLFILMTISIIFSLGSLIIIEQYYQEHEITNANLANWITAIGTIIIAVTAILALHTWRYKEVNLQKINLAKKTYNLLKKIYDDHPIIYPLEEIGQKKTLAKLAKEHEKCRSIIIATEKIILEWEFTFPEEDMSSLMGIRDYFSTIERCILTIVSSYVTDIDISKAELNKAKDHVYAKEKDSSVDLKATELDPKIKEIQSFIIPLLKKFHQI